VNQLATIDTFNQNEESFMKELVETKGANLPARIEDVVKIFEFTDFKAKAWKIMADKMGRLEEQEEAYNSALRSGQHWGIAALYSQKRLGEITREIPKQKTHRREGGIEISGPDIGKQDILKEARISTANSSDAERIAAHPDILDRVIENAKERGEIPTKTAVLNTIRVEHSRDRYATQKKKYEDSVHNQQDKAVSDYYVAIKGFKAALDFARIAAEHGGFAPEGKNLLLKKHGEIRSLMTQLEELV